MTDVGLRVCAEPAFFSSRMTSATLIRGLDFEGFGAPGFFVEALMAGMANPDYRARCFPANAVAPSPVENNLTSHEAFLQSHELHRCFGG